MVLSLWRNGLARSAVNRKVGGSSPPRDGRLRFSNPFEVFRADDHSSGSTQKSASVFLFTHTCLTQDLLREIKETSFGWGQAFLLPSA